MYVAAPDKALPRRIARWASWKLGEAAVELIQRATGFHVPDERLQPYAIALPMLLQTYERSTVRVIKQFVRPGMIAIDGGAHVGYFTRILSKLVGPSGRVLAFEIYPETLNLLRGNVRELANVEVIDAALGPIDGSAILFESPGLSSGHSATATKPGLVARSHLPMRSVSSVLEERGLQRADFIKLDIEGAEPSVIRSLPNAPVSIIFEAKRYILEAGGQTPEAFFAELIRDGYSLTRVGNGAILTENLLTRSALYDKCNVFATR